MKNILLILTFLIQACTPLYAQETGPANSVMRVPSGGGKARMGSIDLGVAGAVGTSVLRMINGGCNKALTASNGALLYSDADSCELSAVGTSGQAMISGGAGAPTWYAPTAGSVLFAGTSGILAQDNTSFFWNDTDDRLRIGLGTDSFTLNGSSKGSALTVSGQGGGNAYEIGFHKHSATLNPDIHFLRSRGSEATPSIVSSGDTIGGLHFVAFDGTDYEYGAKITAEVDGTPGSNDMPGSLTFSVVPDGSSTVAEAVKINQNKTTSFTGSILAKVDGTPSIGAPSGATRFDYGYFKTGVVAGYYPVAAPNKAAVLLSADPQLYLYNGATYDFAITTNGGTGIQLYQPGSGTAFARFDYNTGYNALKYGLRIDNTLGAPASSSMFHVVSTTKGAISAPVMTEAQRDAIGTPATGLQVYNSDSNQLNVYNGSAWRAVGSGASYVFGSTGSPRSVVAATGIVSGSSHMSTTESDQMVFVTSSTASAITAISANPQISNHTIVGSKLRLIGTSDADVFTLSTGNGLWLNGDWSSLNHAILDLVWDGTVWAEVGRNQ